VHEHLYLEASVVQTGSRKKQHVGCQHQRIQ